MRGRRREAAQPQRERHPGEELLRISGLKVGFRNGPARTHALRGIDLTLRAGRIVGVAGESGSGKTTSALAAMGLLSRGAMAEGSIRYGGRELLELPERELRRYRGRHLAMIFQETAAALNPVMRVGAQLVMAARVHGAGGKAEARQRVVAALSDVRLTEADRVMSSYPHELSGGMCQRVIIAMALSCGSNVLLADEPTTALDVSVQQEIIELIGDLVRGRQLAAMMISHDLAVLAETCDDLVVMYSGEVVEEGTVQEVLHSPAHPYTRALLDCLPKLHGQGERLPEPKPAGDGTEVGDGCRFRPRCPLAVEACVERPDLVPVASGHGRSARCWRSATMLDPDSRDMVQVPSVPQAGGHRSHGPRIRLAGENGGSS
ncbi:MAG: ABC transporter ATP-binding protein [Nocardioidaceae bacterium]